MTRVEINPNAELSGGRVSAGFDDVYGLAVHRGETVEVFSGERLRGPAVVDEIDYPADVIYLRPVWSELGVAF